MDDIDGKKKIRKVGLIYCNRCQRNTQHVVIEEKGLPKAICVHCEQVPIDDELNIKICA